MAPLCLLHNHRVCAKSKSINHAQKDNKVRIVYAYDWGTYSDNIALIYEYVKLIINELESKFQIKISFDTLGGNDGSIYCDICRQIQSADIALFDVSTQNPNVILELGIAIGVGKPVFIIRSLHYKPSKRPISDLNGILEYRFSRRSGKLCFQADFKRSLKLKLRHIIKKKYIE